MDHAEAAIRVTRDKAEALDTRMCIAIVVAGARLKAFLRMEDVLVGFIDIAMKAKTVVFFAMKTGAIGRSPSPAVRCMRSEHFYDWLSTGPGALPIVDEHGMLVGAIGVGGSSVESEPVARAESP